MASPANAYPSNRQYESNRRMPEHSQHGPYQSNRSVRSYPETRKPKAPLSLNTELEEDDLNKLDIPDMPPSSVFLTDQTILAGGSSFRLVERPLPNNSLVADTISPLKLAKSEDEGRCQSKYWDRGTLNDISKNIRYSGEWDDLSMDPIFSTISSDSQVIPLQDLISLYSSREVRKEIQEAENQDDEVRQEPSSPKIDCNTWDVMESLEHALSAGRRKQPESTSSTTSTLKDQSQPPRDAEETLAAMGTAGTPKSVRAPARPSPPHSQELQEDVSPDHNSGSLSRSPSVHET